MKVVDSRRRARRPADLGAAAAALVALLSACSREDPTRDAITSLERALESRPNVDTGALTRALESFAASPPRDALPLVRELASDHTLAEDVRFTAVSVLGRMRDPDARAALAAIAADDPSELVRDEAKDALSRGAGGP